MTPGTIRGGNFHPRKMAGAFEGRHNDGFDAIRNIGDRENDLADHDLVRLATANCFLFHVKSKSRVCSQNFDLPDAGNKDVVENLHVEKLHSHSQPLTLAKRQPSIVRYRTQQENYERAVPKWNREASYTCKPGITRASVGSVRDCNRGRA
jgi:hypothetical protein